jgi:predicted DNA-binding transcriptional regulator AlpA
MEGDQLMSQNERRTINLWPDAARQLGLSKNAIYEAARKGEVPGCFRIGKRYLVARAILGRALGDRAESGAHTPEAA